MNLNEIVQAVGGRLVPGEGQAGEVEVQTVSIDSRQIVDPSNCLFFAIKGVRHDGHHYLNDLYQRGVRLFVISSPDADVSGFRGASLVRVPDSLTALQRLAAAIRRKYGYPVVGITGSNGKTIVKEWLFELLQQDLRIVRSPKSYNSQVGVPLSVWNMRAHFDLAILEAGISQPGEMENLAEVIAPTVGLITNLGDAHQENFATKEQKADEKLRLFKTCGLIIYRSDQEVVHERVRAGYAGKGVRLFSWSVTDPGAGLLIHLSKKAKGTVLSFSLEGRNQRAEIPFTDEAGIENACHCLAFMVATGYWNAQGAARFSRLQPVAMRLEIKQGINHCSLVNDYYNSDINSLEMALQFLHHQSVNGRQKKTLILSDIRQSGMTGDSLVREVVRLTGLYRTDRLICIGEQLMKHRSLFQPATSFYHDTDEFLRNLDLSRFNDEQVLLKGAREFRFERIAALLQQKYHQTQLEVDLNALIGNLNRYKALLDPATKVMVMVKAFSYGSGSVEIARALEFQHVDYLAVAVADEGIDLRQAGIETPIIVMNPEGHSFEMMLEYRLEPNLYSVDVFRQFDHAARRMAVSGYPVHLKIESGMNRLGFSSADGLTAVSRQILDAGRLRIQSVFSHLAASDDPAHDGFTRQQHARFCRLSDLVVGMQPHRVIRHLLNSAGIERFPEFQLDMVRLGIGLYGVSQSPVLQAETVARWVTVVSVVKEVLPGETVGYGRGGIVERPRKIAVIPVGYADGFDRRLGNGTGSVWVNGRFFPVIGNVCMDMTMIDVTGSDVRAGDRVELVGDHVTLNDLARRMGTIPYEVLTGISQRVRRIYTLA
ncbi:MAG: bifunctional UDP-N-acetylmuramoyl-tripeptide:D-alanyl-D-alanine ligase/alanine racemase [Mangrovibacterium sp.]|nr:bifunctional UDP-N-acetylmuramoyl-tripeptide:D-alanyl-D-alanine ligase/alanine racemase [Mangrovibacterium sp.]